MKYFSYFIKNERNYMIRNQQNMKDVDGYYFEGKDSSQMAIMTCYSDRISNVHTYEFDKYMVCVWGKCIVIMNGKEAVLNVGDELFIPKGTIHSGVCIPGTRVIYAFGGKRIQNDSE